MLKYAIVHTHSGNFYSRTYFGIIGRYWFSLLLNIFFSVVAFSCGLDVEDPSSPAPPQWVPKSLPGEWPESGIDAHELRGVYLEWEASADEDVEFYSIYRSARPQNINSYNEYLFLVDVPIELEEKYEYLDMYVAPEVRYSYKMKAIDRAGNASIYSDSINYMLLPPIASEYMRPNGINHSLGSNREISWWYNYNMEMENYTITILSNTNILITRQNVTPMNYTGGREIWIIPDTIQLYPDNNYKWRIDTNAHFNQEYESSGSESEWGHFRYN